MRAEAETTAGAESALALPLRRYLAGELSAPVALAQLLLAGASPAALEASLSSLVGPVEDVEPIPVPEAPGIPRSATSAARELLLLLREHREGCERAAALGRAHRAAGAASGDEAIERCRAFFDDAVRLDEVASVAAYSLGSAALLAQATAELVQAFERWGLLGPRRQALEIGCGAGRLLVALAPRLRELHGVDVSPAMLAAAARRLGRSGARRVRLHLSEGRDLAGFPPDSFDLVYAVDSFPYLVQAGVAARHVRDAARLLRAGGDLLIFNYSYRGDAAADAAELADLADETGLTMIRGGVAPLRLWDGRAYHLRKG